MPTKTRDPVRDALFVAEYLVNDYNAYQAALTAGFAEATAVNAGKWIRPARSDSKKPDLWDIVHNAIKGRITHFDATEERIIQEYCRLAFFDVSKLLDEEGCLLPIRDIDVDTRRGIVGVEFDDEAFVRKVIKVRIADKTKALDSLARIRGMFKDKVEHEHTFSGFLDKVSKNASEEPLVSGDGSSESDEEEGF